jgi:riboflavin synthase
MFTGLIQEIGSLLRWQGDSVVIRAPRMAPDLVLGESVAVNGVCLTVTRCLSDGFQADVSPSTRQVSTASSWAAGRRLHLERAVAVGDRLGGHIVSGHVDVVGHLVARESLGVAWSLVFEQAGAIDPYLVVKGSIAIDGVSLTVNTVESSGRFSVTIVPHTGQETCLLDLAAGTPVNLEGDLLAKYVERQLALRPAATAPRGLSVETLARHGFLEM